MKPHLLLLVLLLPACTPAPQSPALSTPLAITQLVQHAAAADHSLAQAQPVIDHLSPNSLPADQPTVRLLVQQARSELTTLNTAAPAVIAQSTQDQKRTAHIEAENAQLKSADPARTWLTRIGLLLLVLSTAALALSLWKFPALKDYALIALLTGAALVTLARFLPQIELAIALASALAVIASLVRLTLTYRTQLLALIETAHPPTP